MSVLSVSAVRCTAVWRHCAVLRVNASVWNVHFRSVSSDSDGGSDGTTTASGLVLQDVVIGSGAAACEDDVVNVHYTLMDIDRDIIVESTWR